MTLEELVDVEREIGWRLGHAWAVSTYSDGSKAAGFLSAQELDSLRKLMGRRKGDSVEVFDQHALPDGINKGDVYADGVRYATNPAALSDLVEEYQKRFGSPFDTPPRSMLPMFQHALAVTFLIRLRELDRVVVPPDPPYGLRMSCPSCGASRESLVAHVDEVGGVPLKQECRRCRWVEPLAVEACPRCGAGLEDRWENGRKLRQVCTHILDCGWKGFPRTPERRAVSPHARVKTGGPTYELFDRYGHILAASRQYGSEAECWEAMVTELERMESLPTDSCTKPLSGVVRPGVFAEAGRPYRVPGYEDMPPEEVRDGQN